MYSNLVYTINILLQFGEVFCSDVVKEINKIENYDDEEKLKIYKK